ncbi:hypothetical protein AAC978_07770 [Desulfitobacterium sp. THU1]|uniref:hypothetical protein n=1 Tax=Desulfitobacterium sp. THU1 TaxID=3138072 RepID=UPI00311FADC0
MVDTHFDVTDAYLQRMKSDKNEAFDVALAVEKHPVIENYYLLVGGFDRYVYLKTLTSKLHPALLRNPGLPLTVT